MDNDCILPKLIKNKVLGIYQHWLLGALLTVLMREKKGKFNPRIIMKI